MAAETCVHSSGAALTQRAEYELEAGIDTNQPELYTVSGRARLLRAKRSPVTAFDSARTLMLTAGAKNAESNEALGDLFRRRAEWRLSRGESAASDIKQGIVHADRALSRSPDLPAAHAVKGVLLLLEANAGATGSRRCVAGAEAEGEIKEAIRLNANLRSRYAKELAAAESLCPKNED